MQAKTVWVIIVLIIIALGAYVLFLSRSAPNTEPLPAASAGASTTTTATTATSGASGVTTPVTITYTNQGFSPQTVTIEEGQTVTWVNQSSEDLWVASDPHPSHTGYDGTSRTTHCAAGYAGPAPFDECTAVPAGGSFSFTFDKVGSWGYHNHMDDYRGGMIVVTAASAASSTTASANADAE